MKRIALLMILALSLYSCETDDDGPTVAYDFSEITGSDLPEYFEIDEEYEINVDYVLPSACHTFAGLEGGQGANEENDSIFEYYIRAVSSYDPALTECTEESDSRTGSAKAFDNFKINSENYSIIRFNFLSGFDSTDEPEYLTVDVPVGEPEPETPEENTNA